MKEPENETIETVETLWQQLLEEISTVSQEVHSAENALSARLNTLHDVLHGATSLWTELKPKLVTTLPSADRKEWDAEQGRLPGKSYHKPLAKALLELGGEATPKQAIKNVEGMMEGEITDEDRKHHASGEIVYRNRIRWARNTFRIKRLIDPNTRSGLWRLTDIGKRFAESDDIYIPKEDDTPGQMELF